MHELKVDEEFTALILPLERKDYDVLEEHIFEAGCNNPIIVWEDTIIDGSNQYEICRKWDLPFRVSRMEFKCRAEAISWICKNQLQRTDIPDEMRKYLIGKYYESEKEAFLDGLDLSEASPKPRGYRYRLAERIGKEVNLVGGTIYKYGHCAQALDIISATSRSLADRIKMGKLRLSQVNIIELSRLPKDEVRELNILLAESKVERINYAEMRHELQWQRLTAASTTSPNKKAKKQNLPIKEIPAYDPDAEISSLTLTIPSWISSIERTRSLSDLPKTTTPAREKLLMELFALHKAVYNIQKMLEEVNGNG